MLLAAAISIVTVWTSIALSFVLEWPIGFFVGALSALAYAAGRTWAWVEIHSASQIPTAKVAGRGATSSVSRGPP